MSILRTAIHLCIQAPILLALGVTVGCTTRDATAQRFYEYGVVRASADRKQFALPFNIATAEDGLRYFEQVAVINFEEEGRSLGRVLRQSSDEKRDLYGASFAQGYVAGLRAFAESDEGRTDVMEGRRLSSYWAQVVTRIREVRRTGAVSRATMDFVRDGIKSRPRSDRIVLIDLLQEVAAVSTEDKQYVLRLLGECVQEHPEEGAFWANVSEVIRSTLPAAGEVSPPKEVR